MWRELLGVAVTGRITGGIRSRTTRPAGPGALLLLIRAAALMIFSARGRRTVSKCANAAAAGLMSRNEIASSTASSMDTQAPSPDVGDRPDAPSPPPITRP